MASKLCDTVDAIFEGVENQGAAQKKRPQSQPSIHSTSHTIGDVFDAVASGQPKISRGRPVVTVLAENRSALDCVLTYCRATYGTGLTTESLNRVIGNVARFHRMESHRVNRLPLTEFAELMENMIAGTASRREKSEGNGGAGSTPKKTRVAKRGRKPLSREKAQCRNEILLAWEQAHSAGTSMKTFCKEYQPPLTAKDLERYVAWKATRNRRKSQK